MRAFIAFSICLVAYGHVTVLAELEPKKAREYGLELALTDTVAAEWSEVIIGAPGLKGGRSLQELMEDYVWANDFYFRKIDGKSYDLRLVGAYWNSETTNSSVNTSWQLIIGKCIAKTSDGLTIVKGSSTGASLAIAGNAIPYDEGDEIRTLGLLAGNYQYRDKQGNERTIAKLHYGEPDWEAYWAAKRKLEMVQHRIEQQIYDSYDDPKNRKRGKLSGSERKAIEFQITRAEAGSAMAQYDLGVRYLKGNGLPLDENKAQGFLLKSANQGHGPAKAKLKEIEARSSP